jgi:hypothetical protein
MVTTLTARSPEDLLAVVPVVLGFAPTDSVVMLTFGAERSFHARVDLPPPEAPVDDLVDCLRDPAVRHGVAQVVFVIYAGAERAAARAAQALVRGFCEAGIEVVDVVRADGRHWFGLLRGRRSCPPRGVPYDVSAHPFSAQAVLDGRVLLGSRAELVATLEPDPDRVRQVAAHLDGLPPTSPAWVRSTVTRIAREGGVPDPALAARLLAAVGSDLDARDAAWMGVPRAAAHRHVALWTDLLRVAPDRVAASAAGILALVAWLAGHGALAWCAVDRARRLEPAHSLAGLVADLLADAVPPTDWQEAFRTEDPA